MRLFRRHFSDSNPRLVSLSPLCDIPTNEADELNQDETGQNSLEINDQQQTPTDLNNGTGLRSYKNGKLFQQFCNPLKTTSEGP